MLVVSRVGFTLLVVLLPGVSLAPLFVFEFTLRRLDGPQQTPHPSSDAKAEANEGQPRRTTKLLVEPLPAEEPKQNAESELEPNRPVRAQAL